MNQGVLAVVSESAGVLTCVIVLLPDVVLTLVAPYNLYSPSQLMAIQAGRDWLPGLQNLSSVPSVRTMANAITAMLPTGAQLPLNTVLTAQNDTLWTAAEPYHMTQAQISPYVNPAAATPTITDAWAVRATITYTADSAARDLFNPTDYHEPETLPGGNQLYYPLDTLFTRGMIRVMSEYAQASGGYYYIQTSDLILAFAYLYTNAVFLSTHFFKHPPADYTISPSQMGISLFDQYYFGEPCLSLHGTTYQTGVGFTMIFQDAGHTRYLESTAPGHWNSVIPAIVIPPAGRRVVGIAPIVGALLVLGMMASAGAANVPLPARRRRNTA